jgi:hypothetical protein
MTTASQFEAYHICRESLAGGLRAMDAMAPILTFKMGIKISSTFIFLPS